MTSPHPPEIQSVIRRSTFRFGGTYAWVRASEVRNPGKHLIVTRDEKETTVVTLAENLGDVDTIEMNPDRWLLLSVHCANPFYCAGFISIISAPLAAAGIDILVVSTFSSDWFFVKESEGERAAAILESVGLERA